MDFKYELGDYEREYNRHVARLWARQVFPCEPPCEPPAELVREAERALEGARQAANIIYEADKGAEPERVVELVAMLFSAERHQHFAGGYPPRVEALVRALDQRRPPADSPDGGPST